MDRSTNLASSHQSRIRKDVKMLQDARQLDRKRRRNIAHREGAVPGEPRQNRPPRRIDERRERAAQVIVITLHYKGNYYPLSRGASSLGRAVTSRATCCLRAALTHRTIRQPAR